MNKIITKTVTPLSLATLLAMSSISMESQANEISDFFLSSQHGKIVALNGMRGKPPYNRTLMKREGKTNLQSVEMSALELDQHGTTKVSSQVSGKRIKRGHPERSKRHTSRY